MVRVEPVMETSLDDVYTEYLDKIEKRLTDTRSADPYTESLVLMSIFEGTTLFIGSQRRWARSEERR